MPHQSHLPVQEIKTHTALECNVVKTLAYFDIFQYPLTREEIFRFLQLDGISSMELQSALDDLTQQRCIHHFDDFYSLRKDATLIPKRLMANQEAEKYLPIARKRAQFIFTFPFVKAVMASGSLSKNCMDENSDIDFFVVTSLNRVWLVRLMMTVYKKIFLWNSHKLFCINYYLDEEHLSLADRNVFTATELITLIPLQGGPVYDRLQLANKSWVMNVFPNFKPLTCTSSENESTRWLKRMVERILNVFPLNWFEKLIMRLTHQRWSKLYRNSMNEKDFNIAFKSEPYVSKAHPRNFQKKVIERYESQLKMYSRKLEMELR
jgi:hypothetical protein